VPADPVAQPSGNHRSYTMRWDTTYPPACSGAPHLVPGPTGS
jgi:hypothetical protein